MKFIIGVFVVRVFSFLFLVLPIGKSKYDKDYLLYNLCGKLEHIDEG